MTKDGVGEIERGRGRGKKERGETGLENQRRDRGSEPVGKAEEESRDGGKETKRE